MMLNTVQPWLAVLCCEPLIDLVKSLFIVKSIFIYKKYYDIESPLNLI